MELFTDFSRIVKSTVYETNATVATYFNTIVYTINICNFDVGSG